MFKHGDFKQHHLTYFTRRRCNKQRKNWYISLSISHKHRNLTSFRNFTTSIVLSTGYTK